MNASMNQLGAALLALFCANALAQPEMAVDAGVSHDTLSGGRSDWVARHLRLNLLKENHESLYAGGRETERFRLKDQEMYFGGVFALGSNFHLQTELGSSPSHHILPQTYGDLNGHLNLGNGWGVDLGGRLSEYRIGTTSVIRGGLERYFGNERVTYTLFSGGPEGIAPNLSHRLQWVHYVNDLDSVGISRVQGHESENLGTNHFTTSKVQGWMLSGHQSLSRHWGLNWEAGTIRQGDMYTRTGVQIAIRHRF